MSDIFDPILQEIKAAPSTSHLRMLNMRVPELVTPAVRSAIDTRIIVRTISELNDAITLRLIELLEYHEGIRLPEGATYLVLGSEGRCEQTLRTDQDSAIVYQDELPQGSLSEVHHFAERLVDALDEIGVPRCPGNIMADSPEWCHTVTEWKKLVDDWTDAPTPENMLNFGMLQDLRALHENEPLSAQLITHIRNAVHRNTIFFPNMAGHVVRFPSPFTMFGRIRVEKNGENKGMLDLKKIGIFAISAGATLLALENGSVGGNTWDKLEFLEKRGIFTKTDHKNILDAFSFLTKLRLKLQLQQFSAGSNPSSLINPESLEGAERQQLRNALEGVKTFLWIFRKHYRLDLISI